MARKKAAEEEGGSWMDTYGDMVTLILTFFVLLYSMSNMEETKYQYIAQAFSSSGTVINDVVAAEENVENPEGNLVEDAKLSAGETPETFDQLYQYLQDMVQEAGLSESVEITKSASSVYLQFRDNVFFGPNSAVLLQDGIGILEKISPGIRDVKEEIMGIRVNGHTAEAASSVVDDYALSNDRAVAVARFLRDHEVIDPSKISSTGFGKYRPIEDNDTEEHRSKNRRVEIIIINKNADYTNPAVMNDLIKMEFGEDALFPSTIDGSGGKPAKEEDSQAPADSAAEPADSSAGGEDSSGAPETDPAAGSEPQDSGGEDGDTPETGGPDSQ